jgi:1-acyl-sn-glycerol-3-phosphate acyltransferase
MLYKLVWLTVAQGSRLLWRTRVVGKERLPREGGYVLAPSHRSMMDIPFLTLATPRPIRFMGKVQSFKLPVLGALFRILGGFPVARDGTDRKAIRDAMAMLANGDILAVFPEGTRQRGPKIEPLQPGAAYLALRAGVPVVPVGIAGSEEIFRSHRRRFPAFGRVSVVVGEPLSPPQRDTATLPRADVDAFTSTLADALQVALDEANELRTPV